MLIQGCSTLISGGASGLGAATARQIVAFGGRVVIADLNESAGVALVESLGEAAAFARTDVTDPPSVESAIRLAKGRFGRLDVAVNCAGILVGQRTVGKDGPMDLAVFERVVRINLLGTFNLSRLAAAAMAGNPPGDDGERGVIIMTASVAAYEGQIGQVAYSASKGGVAAMTLPMARDLARMGIRVVSIAPGAFETPMLAPMAEERRSSLTSQAVFPERLGTPEEYASLACHIVENRYLNGTVIRLDGAMRMGPR